MPGEDKSVTVSQRSDTTAPLRVIHVLRAPLGGLFRHVLDLTREQIARGHHVGLITDSTTGGPQADAALAELAPALRFGVTRIPMRRNPHPGDLRALAHVAGRIRAHQPDVLHGHGSKGGFYARLPRLIGHSAHVVRAYTPHGGSFNYRPGTPIHALYMRAESVLERATDLFLFESAFIADRFQHYVGAAGGLARVALNGLSPDEFTPVPPGADAADFVYVGELRSAKGIDTLISAVALASRELAARPRAVLVGSGPDQTLLMAQAAGLGLQSQISFPGPMPARRAFTLGRVMVVPSRAESLPYVVLEAAGARVPMIATNVGGIPEIFGPHKGDLIAPDDAAGLASAMVAMLRSGADERAARAARLAAFVEAHFSIQTMTDAVISGYRDALVLKAARRPGAARTAAAQ